MNIVYASNEAYVRHMAASMVSLLEKNQGARQLTIYVLSIGITEESRKKLSGMVEQYGRRLCFIELSDIRRKFEFDVDTRGFDISAMGRLFVGRLLPQKVIRVLYLDCDTIVTGPLGKLWNQDLQGKILGAVMEPTIYQAVRSDIGLGEGEPYFNSGVLLIDLKRWRDARAEQKLLDFYRSKDGSLFACDQDTINGGLKGEILSLSPRYNFFPNYRYFPYRELVRCSKVYRQVGKEEFRKAKRCPYIIHYAGDERPWLSGNLNHYRKAYEEALSLTPWAGAEKERGKEWYLLAYHLMDYLTWICPPARRAISRAFGMKVVEARRNSNPSAAG